MKSKKAFFLAVLFLIAEKSGTSVTLAATGYCASACAEFLSVLHAASTSMPSSRMAAFLYRPIGAFHVI